MASTRVVEDEPCKQSRKCSKTAGHKGRCNTQKELDPFWESSMVYQLNVRKRKLVEEKKLVDEEVETKLFDLNAREERLCNSELEAQNKLNDKDNELSSLHMALKESEAKVKESQEKSYAMTQQLEQLKSMVTALGLDPKQFSRSKRNSNSTTKAMTNDPNSSTRYRRRKETEKSLHFIHGGQSGSFYGAWDYIVANASQELVSDFIVGYKRGKHLQKIYSNATKEYQMSPDAMKQAIATKYQNHLSRRRFTLVCKTQTSFFDADSETWLPRNVNCMGIDLRLPKCVSNSAVDEFVKNLDIGNLTQLPDAPGVSRTVTGLVFMIIDLHLRVPHLFKKLVWYNDLENHFIIQFSDDGAPETSQLTMSIGSLTLWNLGERVRSSDYQYLLHCVSLQEKHEVLEDLWIQHSDEMALLEGNILTIAGKQCTVEFQPSADMCWQSWANNELNQAATYPSPYANVHKGNILTIGGSIGFSPEDKWKPYTNADRAEHVNKLAQFSSTLKATLSEKSKHDKKLAYMAENGIRQLGPSRIGVFADKQRPEPLHCEINAWQQVVNIIYLEAVQRNLFHDFINVLGAPLIPDPSPEEALEAPVINGCGLSFLVPTIKEHFVDEKKRHNKIPTRLIGDQAIAIARYGYRLVDSLECRNESPAQRVKRMALSSIILYLRNACTLFNKVSTTPAELLELEENCNIYYNLLCMFFPSHVNVTSWTVGNAIPFHASKLYDLYKVGYGIISQQGKEAKHSGIKDDLSLTNRSTHSNNTGKWWQVLRANYVRSFYLPEHQPVPSTYKSHFKSRVPPHCNSEGVCNCGRRKPVHSDVCQICLDCREIVNCAQMQELSLHLIEQLKPHLCTVCDQRFGDKVDLQLHELRHQDETASFDFENPKDMSVAKLKSELKKRNLCTGGKKYILVKRLESSLWVKRR